MVDTQWFFTTGPPHVTAVPATTGRGAGRTEMQVDAVFAIG
jgi:hypothetical protein